MRLSRSASEWVRRQSLALVLGAAVAVGPAVLAQESASDFIQPRIDRAAFSVFVDQLGFERDEKQIVMLVFTDYASALDDLTARLDAEADAAGRQTVQTALAGRTRMAADQLQQLRLDVMAVYDQAGPAADDEFEKLVLGVESLLLPEQRDRFDAALRALRREALLHTRQAGSGYQEYAGDGVDVLELAEAAVAPGGELEAIGAAALHPILAQYEHQLDALLSEIAPSHRDGALRRKKAGIEKDAAALREEEQASIERWRRLYQLNEATVRQIGDFAANTLGDAPRQTWIERFNEASFTWLYPRRKPERQIEWIRENVKVAETLHKAETAFADYSGRRRTLSKQAMDMMIRARLEFRAMLHPMMDPSSMNEDIRSGLYQELLKNSGEQATLESSAAAALESLLTDAQREDMRTALKRPDRAGRRR